MKMKRTYIEVNCISCEDKWMKLKDTMKGWSGRCHICARIEIANRVEVKATRSKMAKKQVFRQGGIKNRRIFTSDNMRGENHWNWKGGKQTKILTAYNIVAYIPKSVSR